jgi:type I restriction enzyme S subunit
MTNRGVRWGRIDPNETVLAPLTKQDTADLRLDAGDVLVCEGGEIGRASVWRDELPECYYQNTLHRLRPISGYQAHLLVAFLEQWAKSGALLALVGKSSLAHLTKENLTRVTIPAPSAREQAAIVETLASIDHLISALEHLIVKKQSIKQGMVHQLLTGRTRLPGFRSDWIPQQLGSVLDRLQAGVSVNSVPDPGPYSVLKTSSVSGGEFDPLERKTVAPSDIRRAKVSPRADSLIISRMNTPALVGEVGYVAADWPTVFLPDRLWLATKRRTTSVNMRWLGYVLSSARYREQLREIATGTSGSMKNIARTAFLQLSVPFPRIEEQAAISSTLADLDRDLGNCRARLVKANDIKQGIMQQLLTGRTRLPV